jgi:hypothetical protein
MWRTEMVPTMKMLWYVMDKKKDLTLMILQKISDYSGKNNFVKNIYHSLYILSITACYKH